jgi:demethylmenaquinone methyltransferase / 2-methoxy-6-polyprenyl-1,4-benzoquinol methylase
MVRAQLDRKPGEVSAMFDQVAERYDLLNDALSLGMDRQWRQVVAGVVGGSTGQVVLDLAAGTGTSSRAFTTAGARCVACDFSIGMLRVGARKQHGPGGARRCLGTPQTPMALQPPAAKLIRFVAGDALSLPFADGSFDVVTISFGLRNLADPGHGLAEMLRVTSPGGRLVVCEFSHLPARWLNAAYEQYLSRVLPLIAGWLSGNAEAYDYLAESIKDWPAQRELASMITAAGWSRVRWRNLSLGVVAIHVATRPG